MFSSRAALVVEAQVRILNFGGKIRGTEIVTLPGDTNHTKTTPLVGHHYVLVTTDEWPTVGADPVRLAVCGKHNRTQTNVTDEKRGFRTKVEATETHPRGILHILWRLQQKFSLH